MENRSTHWPKYWHSILLGGFLLGGQVCAQGRPPDAPPASAKLDKAKLSYAIGYQIGDQFADMRGVGGWNNAIFNDTERMVG